MPSRTRAKSSVPSAAITDSSPCGRRAALLPDPQPPQRQVHVVQHHDQVRRLQPVAGAQRPPRPCPLRFMKVCGFTSSTSSPFQPACADCSGASQLAPERTSSRVAPVRRPPRTRRCAACARTSCPDCPARPRSSPARHLAGRTSLAASCPRPSWLPACRQPWRRLAAFLLAPRRLGVFLPRPCLPSCLLPSPRPLRPLRPSFFSVITSGSAAPLSTAASAATALPRRAAPTRRPPPGPARQDVYFAGSSLRSRHGQAVADVQGADVQRRRARRGRSAGTRPRPRGGCAPGCRPAGSRRPARRPA